MAIVDPGTAAEPALVVSAAQLQASLEEQIASGEQLRIREVSSIADLNALQDDFNTWDEYNSTLLRRSFTTSRPADEYAQIITPVVYGETSLSEKYHNKIRNIERRVRKLRSMLAQIPLYAEFSPPSALATPRSDRSAQGVFIVHGHNEAVRQSVARFVLQITEHEPVILHEQANSGQTVIEKFERHAEEIGFAIILLTGDDEGRKRGAGELQVRARQNVILELGFFIAAIGRERVAALHEPGVELPSDVSGMLYTALNGDWKLELGREMRFAGIIVDLNRAR